MLQETINNKWKEAFKAKNLPIRAVYECLRAKILVEEKSGRYELPLTDEQILNIVIKEIKELKESQSFYKIEDPRYDEFTLKINELEQYMPKQLTEDEVKNIILKLKETESNMGKLIGLTVKEVGSRFDKSQISRLVKELL